MAENITKISSSYDMVEIMKNIGSNYFGSDISDQRIGMFGFTTESLANIFGAAILDASNRQREYNVCTARKRSTLLYEGSKLETNIDNAIPTKMSAYLGLLTTAITNPSHKGGFGTEDKSSSRDTNHPNYKLVLEKDTVITIANYSFMVENDIQIKATYNQLNDSYTYSVQYLLKGDIDTTSLTGDYTVPSYNTAYDITDKYIQSYVQSYSKDINILLFKVELVQINKESTIYPIVKNDLISLTGLDFPYSNNLSHFNIFYRKNNTSTWQQVPAIPTYLSDKQYDKDVIFYETMHDEKKIRLNITDFNPAYNSEIRVDIYNTMGAETNGLTYSGDGSDIIIQLNTLDERHSYTGLELNCKPISSATGGSNVPTLEELRTRVIRAKQTVNSYDTDIDLINYMKDRDSTNDYVFVKKRNDIIERRYSCYMIPRMLEKDIIPTSTLDLCIPNFKASIDPDAEYFNFTQANALESINDANLYYLNNKSFTGRGKDTGIDFYKISEVDNISNLSKANILNCFIPTSYVKDNSGYTKNSTYTVLSKYLDDNKINITSLNDDEFLALEVNNNVTIDDTKLYKFKLEDSNNDAYVFNTESKKFVRKSSLYSDELLSKMLLKDVKYTVSRDNNSDKSVYLSDNNGNYYYNPLNGKTSLYIMINTSDGQYRRSDDSDDATYMLADNAPETYIMDEKYDRINISNPGNIELRFSLNDLRDSYNDFDSSNAEYNTKYKYAYYKNDNLDIIRVPILVAETDIDNIENIIYTNPLSAGNNLYKITEVISEEDLNDILSNPDSIPADQRVEDTYVILSSKPGDSAYEAGYLVSATFNSNNTPIKEYLLNRLATYSSKSKGEWDQNNIKNNPSYVYMNNDGNVYFYKYLGDTITIGDIIFYNKELQTDYDRDTETNFGYYVTSSKETYMIRKLLYQKNSISAQSSLKKYIYNSQTNCYVEQISDEDIAGITYSTNSNGDKESITIKAGTPLSLISDIKNRAWKTISGSEVIDKDGKVVIDDGTRFDLTSPGYQYPIISAEMVYNYVEASKENGGIYRYDEDTNSYVLADDNYTGTRYLKQFGLDNSLLVINTNEKIDDDKDRYSINNLKGITWNKTNKNLEEFMKVYTTPYTIVYDISNQVASYFLTSVSKDINMNMIEEENDTPVNFAIDSINVNRNSVIDTDNSYEITVDIITNGDITNAEYNGEKNTGSVANSIMLKGFIYDSIGSLKGYFDFIHDDSVSTAVNMFRFKGKIEITDTLSDTHCTSMLNMYNIGSLNFSNNNEVYRTYNDGVSTYDIAKNQRPDNQFINLNVENLRISIGCYYLNRVIKDNNGTINERDLSKYSKIVTGDPTPILIQNSKAIATNKVGGGILSYPRFISTSTYTNEDESEIVADEEYILTNVYDNSMDLLDLFIDMSNFVKSSVNINTVNNDGSGADIESLELLHLTDIPVIQFSQCVSDNMANRISNIIADTHENLTDLSSKITNNFGIDYKFFRTYGPCRYFKLEHAGDGSTEELGNLDITISFKLLIKSNLTISDNDVVNQLKLYIKQRIEELNSETDDDDYTVYISNIITDIENEFNDYVRSIELTSINGKDSSYRIIRYNKPSFNDIDFYTAATRSDVKEYVPEYINVPVNNITISIRR